MIFEKPTYRPILRQMYDFETFPICSKALNVFQTWWSRLLEKYYILEYYIHYNGCNHKSNRSRQGKWDNWSFRPLYHLQHCPCCLLSLSNVQMVSIACYHRMWLTSTFIIANYVVGSFAKIHFHVLSCYAKHPFLRFCLH